MKDIEDFIVQSIDLSIEWSTIRLVGWEPTLHPQLVCIAKMIKEEYIIKHSPKTTLNLYSNGIVEYADLKKELKNAGAASSSTKTAASWSLDRRNWPNP